MPVSRDYNKITFTKRNDNYCPHKFSHDLGLEYVDWEVNTLFIGTFNPGCCKNNKANWFYGRTDKNMFWDTLGLFYENNAVLGQNGNIDLWKAFCKRNKIAVTDLIESIDEVDMSSEEDQKNLCKNFSDKKLELYLNTGQYSSNYVENLILNSPKLSNLKCVYLTRATTDHPWNQLWNPINTVCLERGINVQRLLTPGGFNYFQFNQVNFPRISENLLQLWCNNYHLTDCQE